MSQRHLNQGGIWSGQNPDMSQTTQRLSLPRYIWLFDILELQRQALLSLVAISPLSAACRDCSGGGGDGAPQEGEHRPQE